MTVFYIDDVDTAAAGALSNTQQLLLHMQSPNQSNLLLSAPKSVPPSAFYSSLISLCLLFSPLSGRLQAQSRCFVFQIVDGGSNRDMNYSLSCDYFSIFLRQKFSVFFLSVSDIFFTPNQKGTFSTFFLLD